MAAPLTLHPRLLINNLFRRGGLQLIIPTFAPYFKRSMISRRLVRIKTMQALYAWQQMDVEFKQTDTRILRDSLLKTYDVYLFLLEFPWYLNRYLESKKEAEKLKYYPDKQTIREYGILLQTPLIDALSNKVSTRKRHYFTTQWIDLAEGFDSFFAELKQQDFFADYLVFDAPDFKQQKFFLENVFGFFINGNEVFNLFMEDIYTGWNEDDEIIFKEIKRTLDGAKEDGTLRFAEQDGADTEDVVFGLTLFELVAQNSNLYETQVADITENWDPTRIATLDLIAIKMALTEFLEFSKIPVKVTINEYLDIVKDYSTPNSSRFLNGILDKMRKKLEENGKIVKLGRGLRDN